MEEQITTVGTILLGAFYAIGYLLNRHPKKSAKPASVEEIDLNSSESISTLSSTVSESTSLNMLLWQRITALEVQQEQNQHQIELLKLSNQQKDYQISKLEQQIREFLLTYPSS